MIKTVRFEVSVKIEYTSTKALKLGIKEARANLRDSPTTGSSEGYRTSIGQVKRIR